MILNIDELWLLNGHWILLFLDEIQSWKNYDDNYNYIIQFPNSIGLNKRNCEIDYLILKNNLNKDEVSKAYGLSVFSVSFEIFKQIYDEISKQNKFCIVECRNCSFSHETSFEAISTRFYYLDRDLSHINENIE